MRKPVLLTFLLFTNLIYSQESVYRWQGELCGYLSTYDSKQFSENQINNCYLLTYQNFFRISHIPSVFKPQDLERLNLDTLENEYIDKTRMLESLDLPNIEYWQKLRVRTLTELEQVYSLSRITYLGFKYPDYFKDWHFENPCLAKHANALINGGDSLLNDWFNLTSELVKNNCCPEKVWAKYNEQLKSEERLIHAQIYVVTFGWWNCANKYIEYVKTEDQFAEFLKLFLKTDTIDCDEP